MIKLLEIEWLKSKRTKAFLIATLMVFLGVLWQIIATGHTTSNILSSLLVNQTTDAIILPITTMVFTNRIVKNEHEGLTFKLQTANGLNVFSIFHSKLTFSLLFFTFLASLEISLFLLYALFQGGQLHVTPLAIKWLGLLISYAISASLYLTLNIYCQKQGIIWGVGLMSSFLGLIFEAYSSHQLWTGILPWQTPAFLSPYQYHYIGEKAGQSISENIKMPQLGWHFAISILLLITLYESIITIIKRNRSF